MCIIKLWKNIIYNIRGLSSKEYYAFIPNIKIIMQKIIGTIPSCL